MVNRFDLSQDYLPPRLLGDEQGWYALPYGDKESLQSLKRTIAVAFTYIEHRPEIDPATFYKVLVTIFDDRDKTMNGWFDDELAKLSNPPFKTKARRPWPF